VCASLRRPTTSLSSAAACILMHLLLAFKPEGIQSKGTICKTTVGMFQTGSSTSCINCKLELARRAGSADVLTTEC
jgi:hypothetical protein